MYISDVERKAKGRKLQHQRGEQSKRFTKDQVRKALENAILALDKTMTAVDEVVESYWMGDDGKALGKVLPAKNHANDAADEVYMAKQKLFRAIKLLGGVSGRAVR
jgi:flagellar hook-basal body complex protein FliE